jgi:integrase
MAITTGGRRSEILNLKWTDIDWEFSTAYLKDTKNGKPRSLILMPDIVEQLKKNKNESEYIFPHSESPSRPIKHIDAYWRNALKEAEIENLRIHDLRHTTASMCAKRGASLLQIGSVLGHRSQQTTLRYAHLCVKDNANLLNSVMGGVL